MNENDVEIECIPVVLDDQGNDEQLIERFSQLITKIQKVSAKKIETVRNQHSLFIDRVSN